MQHNNNKQKINKGTKQHIQQKTGTRKKTTDNEIKQK